MATEGNPLLSPSAGAPIVDRIIPVTETLFAPFNLIYMIVVGGAALCAIVALHPRRNPHCLSPDQIEKILPKPPEIPAAQNSLAGRLDAFPGWTLLAALLIAYPLGYNIYAVGFGRAWNINAYNMAFLAIALLLHPRPISFVNACREGVGATWGIILQFPFYAGMYGLMKDTGLGDWLSEAIQSATNGRAYPFVIYVYSAIVNMFVPSGGSKWLIEAPYLIPAGKALGVSPTTVVLAYAYGDSTTNLIQPFWTIPILAVSRLRFGDVVGYMFLVAAVCFVISAIAMFLIPLDL